MFAATPPYDGTLARYYPIPSDLCYKLPDNLTLEDGSPGAADGDEDGDDGVGDGEDN